MAKFKVGDKVKYHGRKAVVTEVHHDGESDYLLDVEGAGGGWYADEDEVTAANAARNAKDGLGAEIKVGDTAKFLTGTWRGLEGKVLKIDGSRATVRTKEQGDVVEDLKVIRLANAAPVRSTNAVVRNALAARNAGIWESAKEAEDRSDVFVRAALGRTKYNFDTEAGTLREVIKLLASAEQTPKIKKNTEKLKGILSRVEKAAALFKGI